MNVVDLENTARALVSAGQGILAVDETSQTLTSLFELLRIDSTMESHRDYRQMLFTTPGIGQFISGAIMQDETFHQKDRSGNLLTQALIRNGVMPGIKIGAVETTAESFDTLPDRLKHYHDLGGRFAEGRATIRIGDRASISTSISPFAQTLARYAGLCQEQNLVPIVAPEVVMDGAHTIEACEAVTGSVLRATFEALFEQHVSIEGVLIKIDKVVAGAQCPRQSSIEEAAHVTLRCLRRSVPVSTPGILLSEGQDSRTATLNLNAINQEGSKPWKLSFSYGRALQDDALRAWLGKTENTMAAQLAFWHRARCVGAAARGKYTPSMEGEFAA